MTTTYAIPNGRTAMYSLTYTGDGTSPRTISGWNFQPDFIWTKSRNAANDHGLIDSNRGIGGQYLNSDLTHEEWAAGANVTAFTSNGYTAITGTNNFTWGNTNGTTYVGWAWNAGSGSNVSNTSGTVTSTVSANTTAGFSIAKFTGTGAVLTFGHGLGATPSFIVMKTRNQGGAGYHWVVYHSSIGNTGAVFLDTTGALSTSSGYWNNTSPNASVITIGTAINTSGTDTMVAYCWAPIEGFSSFGSWSGNANADGPFIYTGFRPSFLLYKQSNGNNSWAMVDSSRDAYNPEQSYLLANSNGTEGTTVLVDFLSNGFKVRTNLSGTNGSGETMIYAAFAENPFKYANAR